MCVAGGEGRTDASPVRCYQPEVTAFCACAHARSPGDTARPGGWCARWVGATEQPWMQRRHGL